MKEITKNPNFEYEIACDQMCGNGHYSMKGLIKVVTKEEFAFWRAQQQPAYKPATAAAPAAQPATADSTKPATGAVVADKAVLASNK
jgi:cytochrome c oxidase subunit 2